MQLLLFHVVRFLVRLISWRFRRRPPAPFEPRGPYELSDSERARFKFGVLRVDRPAGDSWIFGIDDCVVYKARIEHEVIVGWNVVLASDWGGTYPKWMTVCTRASIEFDGTYVHAFLCGQAIGAGGGCANGGYYRSRTGEARGWQILRGEYWIDLPNNDQPPAVDPQAS